MGKKEKQERLEEKKRTTELGEQGPAQSGNEMVPINLPAMTVSLTRSQAKSLYESLGLTLGIEGKAGVTGVGGRCPECGSTTGCSHMPIGAES